MAFTCIKNDEQIYSFVYSLKDWITLKEDKASSFNMACCGNQAILKTSKLGTQFFAHKVKPKTNYCSTGGETPEHIHIKYLVSKRLFECGWRVEVEKRGVSSKGDVWIADIYAEKDSIKLAIEVQWSHQSFVEIKRRQQVYKDSGVRGAWLLRSGSVKHRNAIVGDFMYSTKSVPVFSIYKNKRESNNCYEVYNVNKINVEQGLIFKPLTPIQLELSDFVEKLVSSKIKFHIQSSPTSQLSLNIMKMECSTCHKITETVVKVMFKNTVYGIEHSSNNYAASVEQCNEDTIESINTSFSKMYGFTPLRSRYSKKENGSYIANSCTHCDALMERSYLKSWGDYYSKTLFKTNEITVPRNSRMEFGNMSFYNRVINYDVGRWVLIDTF